MNKDRRNSIEAAKTLLSAAQTKIEEANELLESAKGEEQQYFDNMPESLQGGEKGVAAEAAVTSLEQAIDACETAISSLGEADTACDEVLA